MLQFDCWHKIAYWVIELNPLLLLAGKMWNKVINGHNLKYRYSLDSIHLKFLKLLKLGFNSSLIIFWFRTTFWILIMKYFNLFILVKGSLIVLLLFFFINLCILGLGRVKYKQINRIGTTHLIGLVCPFQFSFYHFFLAFFIFCIFYLIIFNSLILLLNL